MPLDVWVHLDPTSKRMQHIAHNEIQDITYSLLSEVCTDIILEPVLQPLNGHLLGYMSAIKDDLARSGIPAKGYWGTPINMHFLRLRKLNPYAQSNTKFSIPIYYAHQE